MSAGRCVASITFAMVKVLPEPVTPSSTWVRSLCLTPVHQLGDRLRLVATRLELRLEASLTPPSLLSGRGRPMRRPWLLAKLGPPLAQKLFQRLLTGEAREAAASTADGVTSFCSFSLLCRCSVRRLAAPLRGW